MAYTRRRRPHGLVHSRWCECPNGHHHYRSPKALMERDAFGVPANDTYNIVNDIDVSICLQSTIGESIKLGTFGGCHDIRQLRSPWRSMCNYWWFMIKINADKVIVFKLDGEIRRTRTRVGWKLLIINHTIFFHGITRTQSTDTVTAGVGEFVA